MGVGLKSRSRGVGTSWLKSEICSGTSLSTSRSFKRYNFCWIERERQTDRQRRYKNILMSIDTFYETYFLNQNVEEESESESEF